jgi:hypothetical protein
MNTPPQHFTKIKDLAREPIGPVPDFPLTRTLFVSGREPVIETRQTERVKPTYSSDADSELFRLDLELPRAALGVHAFPPGLAGTKLDGRRKLLAEDGAREVLTGHLPDHLALRAVPQHLDKRLASAKKIDALRAAKDPEARWATTVFAPDNRYTFSDTAFPWCTSGRVETSAGGWASGVMVGPRHLLTCSHAIQ